MTRCEEGKAPRLISDTAEEARVAAEKAVEEAKRKAAAARETFSDLIGRIKKSAVPSDMQKDPVVVKAFAWFEENRVSAFFENDASKYKTATTAAAKLALACGTSFPVGGKMFGEKGSSMSEFHLAVSHGKTEISKFITDRADQKLMNSRDEESGKTALHYAAERDDEDLFDYLLVSAPKPWTRDNEGRTAGMVYAERFSAWCEDRIIGKVSGDSDDKRASFEKNAEYILTNWSTYFKDEDYPAYSQDDHRSGRGRRRRGYGFAE